MQPSCDIVIPVYNSPEWVELCVEAVFLSDVSDAVNRVILIDDCSNQETQELLKMLCNKFQKLSCIRNEKNSGFVKSCNRGMSESRSEFIMLLNSDCLLASDTTAKLITILQNDHKAGLISPLSNNAANLSVPIPVDMNYVQVDKMLWENIPFKHYQACTIVGNCMVITRNCYNTIGGLDEVFGMGYGEETDYQFRAAEAGFSAIIAGNVYVFHKSMVSFGDNSNLSEQKKHNREIFFARWGKQYNDLLVKYEKNNPVVCARKCLSENIGRVNSFPFTESFFDRLDRIDRNEKETVQEDRHTKRGVVSRGYKYFSKHGFRAFIRKILKKLLLPSPDIEMNATASSCELLQQQKVQVYFKDLLVVYEGEETRRLRQLSEMLSYAAISTDTIQVQALNQEIMKWYRGCLLLDISKDKILDRCLDSCKKNHKILIADAPWEVLYPYAEYLTGVILRSVQEMECYQNYSLPVLYVPDQKTDEELADELDELEAEKGMQYQPWVLNQFVKDLLPPAVAFILPHIKPNGGITVALEHIHMLKEFGYDAFAINLDGDETTQFLGESEIRILNGTIFAPGGHIDKMVATSWDTVRYMDQWQCDGEKYYLVQGQEALFYTFEESRFRQEASKTYLRDDVQYITVSQWCQDWLKRDYGREAQLVWNGLNPEDYPFKARENGKKTVILIEGNCGLASKNVDEGFKITNHLNKENYHIIFVTNYGEPKDWYIYDEFYRSVPRKEMYQIYRRADILLKTSLMESFSYPPLEMMSTGGCVVAIPNDGNLAYLKDGHNCLLFNHGDLEAGIAAIERLRQDPELRKRLIKNGLISAKSWAWNPEQVLVAYGSASKKEAVKS